MPADIFASLALMPGLAALTVAALAACVAWKPRFDTQRALAATDRGWSTTDPRTVRALRLNVQNIGAPCPRRWVPETGLRPAAALTEAATVPTAPAPTRSGIRRRQPAPQPQAPERNEP